MEFGRQNRARRLCPLFAQVPQVFTVCACQPAVILLLHVVPRLCQNSGGVLFLRRASTIRPGFGFYTRSIACEIHYWLCFECRRLARKTRQGAAATGRRICLPCRSIAAHIQLRGYRICTCILSWGSRRLFRWRHPVKSFRFQHGAKRTKQNSMRVGLLPAIALQGRIKPSPLPNESGGAWCRAAPVLAPFRPMARRGRA